MAELIEDSAIVDFVASSTRTSGPVFLDEVCEELHSLAENGADWPLRSARWWMARFERVVEDGLLVVEHVEGRRVVARPRAVVQGRLFD